MGLDKIVVRGARQHNLKNITVEIPRDKMVVITGLSGSGKSSLAFDTIYAEGQRRYVESLVALRAAVPRADGQARRRRHRRPLAGGLHRPEIHHAQPALHRRHGHRDLRLPAPALRADRPAALPAVRARDRAADRRADGGRDHGAAGGHEDPGPRAARARARRASIASSSRTCARRASCACESTARSTRSPTTSRWTATSSTPSRS